MQYLKERTMQIKVHAQAIEHDGQKFIRIKSDVEIVHITGPTSHRLKRTRGIWDTGCTHTSIPLSTAKALGLTLGEEVPALTVSSVGKSYPCQFLLHFPNIGVIQVTEGLAVEDMKTSLLIGMDVMSRGVTTIEPDGGGGVVFTFET